MSPFKLSMLCASGPLALAVVTPAKASEGGASFYLLGSGGPGAGMLPPIRGIFFDNSFFYYDASAGTSRQFVLGGNVVADLRAKIASDFMTVLAVPTTDFLGGTLAVGAAVAVGRPQADV